MKLQGKIAAITIVVAVVPLLLALFLFHRYSVANLYEVTRGNAKVTVEQSAKSLSEYFQARIDELEDFARMPLVVSRDWQKLRPYLQNRVKVRPDGFSKYFIGLPSGHFYATSAAGNASAGGLASFNDDDPNATLKTMLDRPYWQNTVGDNLLSEPRTFINEPTISYTTGQQQITIATSILDSNGQLQGAFGGALEWPVIQRKLIDVTQSMSVAYGEGIQLFLITGDGTYVYHDDPDRMVQVVSDGNGAPLRNVLGEQYTETFNITEEPSPDLATIGQQMMAGASGAEMYVDPLLEQRFLLTFAPVNTTGYSLGLLIPKALMIAPAEQLRFKLLMIAGLSILAALLAAVWLARKMSRPVLRLTEAAARVSSGQTDLHLTESGQDELADLTRSFNKMSLSLRQRDQLVQRRQSQLQRLSVAAQDASSTLQIDAVLHTLISHAMELVDAERGVIGRSEAGLLRVQDLCYGELIETVDHYFSPGEYSIGRLLQAPVARRLEGVDVGAQVAPELTQGLDVNNLISVPILDRTGQLLGCFELYNSGKGHVFDCQDVEMLQGLAAFAAVAIENANAVDARESAVVALKKSKAQLQRVAETVSVTAGEKFFDRLVVRICEELNMEHAFVGLISKDAQHIEVLAACSDGALADDFCYALKGTPCAQALVLEQCYYDADVQRLFPEDTLLNDMNAACYAGVVLKDDVDRPLGLIGILSVTPQAMEQKLSLLKLFSLRASAELQRQQTDDELRLAATAFQTHEAIMICNNRTEILRVNKAFVDITGYSEEEAIGKTPGLLSSGTETQVFYDTLWANIERQGYWQGEIWNRRKGGELYAQWLSINAVKSQSGHVTHYVGAFLDLTDQKQQQALIARGIAEEGVVSSLLRLSHRGTSVEQFIQQSVDILARTEVWTQRIQRVAFYSYTKSGVSESLRIVAHHNLDTLSADDCVRKAVRRYMPESDGLASLSGDAGWQITDCPELCAEQQVFVAPIRDKELLGAVVCCSEEELEPGDIAFVKRITDVLGMAISRRQAEDRFEFQAFHDDLTGLPNRRMLIERLKQEVAVAIRRELHGAVLFIDLDQFKRLNDALGHSVGDLLLKQVADRLKNLLRAQDTVARLGGDEFVIILPALDGGEDEAANHAYAVADKVRWELSQFYFLGEHEFHLTPSIGIVLFPTAGEGVDDLLKHADTAMYQAKKEGRNTARFYKPSMQDAASHRLTLEKDLRHALNRNELELHYQPQVLADGSVIGAEVLIRWGHPEHGVVSPVLFIPVAEDTGLILEIGEWVLRTACEQIRRWEVAGVRLDHLAVNVSPKQFRQPDFVAIVERVLDETGIDPRHLDLEVTEGMLIQDVEYTIEKMERIRDLGVRFSIDDFGTGYSSLAYLKRLPLDILKIDRSFVQDVHRDTQDAAICTTIIAMAKNLDLAVVAEGVETEEEQAFLADNGCDIYQGYYYSRPLALDAFEDYLVKQGVGPILNGDSKKKPPLYVVDQE